MGFYGTCRVRINVYILSQTPEKRPHNILVTRTIMAVSELINSICLR